LGYSSGWCLVLNSFKTGVIFPILKKPGPNLSDPSNFRPVTLSSSRSYCSTGAQNDPRLSDLRETVWICDKQFGFRKNMGTALAYNLFTDVLQYYQQKHTPLYCCSLDAE
jgi:hypothetical protein